MKKPILSVGRLYCDLVFADAPRLPTPGTEVFAPSLSLHAGGGAFITGATFAGLGHAVSLAANFPAAPFDTIVGADIAAHGVDATYCATAQNGTDPQITVAIGAADDRAFLTRAAGAALPDLSALTFAHFKHLHIGELRTLQDVPTLLDSARSNGMTVSVDCGWQDDFDTNVADLIANVDVFLPNESEAAALLQLGIEQDCAPLTVVKCGPRGARAIVHGDNDWIDCPIASPVKVRDTTGAGDAFNGGFLSRWLENAALLDCLTQGNACGAATVQVVGGLGHLVKV
ncbi:MAG: carbohydrate kinase family protein [Roseobacter sp.]